MASNDVAPGGDSPELIKKYFSETASSVSAGDSPEPIMKFFRYGHLPPALQEHSRPFCELAEWIIATKPRSAERTVALRKLLESKDAAVRSALP